jgi:PAS domain S-box-containing protein
MNDDKLGTVLVVDDAPEHIDVLREILKENFNIKAASNSRKALEIALNDHRPDLILLDILMPDMDGYEVCRRLKADERTRDIPVIFVTVLDEEEDEAKGFDLGAVDYITKPFSPAIVNARVKTHLNLAGVQRQLEHAYDQMEQRVHQRTAELDRADKALWQSEERVRKILESVEIGIMVIDRETHEIVEINRSALKMIGAPRDRVVGRVCHHYLCPEDEGKCPVTDLNQDMDNSERELMTDDGRRLPILKTVVPVNLDGREHLLESFLDMTERNQAEEARRESEETFRQAFEYANIGMALIHPDGSFLKVNAALSEMLGYPQEELLTKSFIDLTHPDDPNIGEDFRREALAGRKHKIDFEKRYVHKSGREVWVYISSSLVRDAQGAPRYFVSQMQDITGRRRLEEQFLQSQKMEAVGRLAGGVAHDFNNLLTIITGYGELVLQRLHRDDPIRQEIEQIKNAGERASALTRQLLAFSRRQVLEPQVLQVNRVIGNLEKMLKRLIGEDIELIARLAPDAGSVNFDPGQLEQVILNLVVNARDAMPQGGKLVIETGPVDLENVGGELDVTSGPYVMLAISDTGTGMGDEVRAHIFEPFFTTKSSGKGTGLGLSTVFGIVKQSGGDIQVHSELGQGTTFRVYLPRTEVDEQDSAVSPQKAKAPRGTETILLVEDESGLRKLTTRLMEEQGYRVVPAAGGMEALNVLESHQDQIHLVLTDVIMPGMSGKELADRVRALRPDTKILFTSGYTDEAIALHGVLVSESKFISKPFLAEDLAKKIRQVLDED